MSAGYSKRSLTEKLGIKRGSALCLINHPEDYGELLFPIPADCSVYDKLHENVDIIQYFSTSKDELAKDFPKLKSRLKPEGSLWITWQKKPVIARSKTTRQSPPQSDLDENIIREIGLENGLVDVKVIAVNETWSGLKFVYRLEGRDKKII